MLEDKDQSFLSSYAKPAASSASSGDDDYRAFSFGRVGSRSQAMLTFIKKNDYVEAIAYAKLDRVYSSDINTELKLDFGDRQVLIKGTNLSELFRYICLARCSEVTQQTSLEAMSSKEKDPTIDTLDILCTNSDHGRQNV